MRLATRAYSVYIYKNMLMNLRTCLNIKTKYLKQVTTRSPQAMQVFVCFLYIVIVVVYDALVVLVTVIRVVVLVTVDSCVFVVVIVAAAEVKDIFLYDNTKHY